MVGLACTILCAAAAQTSVDDPDELYRNREDLASAVRAADAWQRAGDDVEAAWKLSRVCYWLGTHLPERARRSALERGVDAGETATRLASNRPEGHFWLAADMGALAESFGVVQGLKYRGRIKAELQRVLALEAGWQGGSAEAALGQWYFEVPRLLGGSHSEAEAYLRRALTYDPQNLLALSFLADVLASDNRRDEAATLLERVLAAPISRDWAPEDREFKRKAVERLKALAR
jgi:tetratricopeptide (TPR) repeat protein